MHPALQHHQKAFVLLSGGIDSATCLYIANENMRKSGGSLEAVSMDYGQRHLKETECAKKLCDSLGIKHTIIDVRGALGKDSMLTDASREVPNISYDEIKGISPTYVPFRNGFMLARLAAYAQEYVMQIKEQYHPDQDSDLNDLVTLYIGTHAEDAKNWAYPDCTPQFIGAMTNAIYTGTYNAVQLLAPLLYMRKDQIIRMGWELFVPYQDTWSCYKGEELHCGVCPTCRARKKAFEDAANIAAELGGTYKQDPTKYANDDQDELAF